MFSYFFPGSTVQPKFDQIAARGFGYAFDVGNMAANPMTNQTGPNGQSGVILAREAAFAQFEKNQSWQVLPKTDGVMIGYRTGQMPTPDQLERPNKFCPATVAAEWGGLQWNLPQVRFYEPNATKLECQSLFGYRAEFDGSGWVQGSVIPEQQKLVECRDTALQIFTGSFDGKMGDVLDLIVSILQSAYFISGHELTLLGLMRFDTAAHVVLRTLIDADGFHQLKKKLDSVGN